MPAAEIKIYLYEGRLSKGGKLAGSSLVLENTLDARGYKKICKVVGGYRGVGVEVSEVREFVVLWEFGVAL